MESQNLIRLARIGNRRPYKNRGLSGARLLRSNGGGRREGIAAMTCSHLVSANDVHAFYSLFDKTLTIAASVTLQPGDYEVQICRSIIDRPESLEPEFTIAAPKPSGVHTD